MVQWLARRGKSELPGESEPQARIEKKNCLVTVCCPSYLNSPLYNTTLVRTLPKPKELQTNHIK
jgi:hypothetical protein